MKEHEEARFRELSRDLTEDIRVRRMSQYIQHGSTTTYDHVLRVARTAYRLNHILHLKADDHSLIRASILHDYYLYDWHQQGDRLHGYHHARIAADNALRDFAISPAEQAMIRISSPSPFPGAAGSSQSPTKSPRLRRRSWIGFVPPPTPADGCHRGYHN